MENDKYKYFLLGFAIGAIIFCTLFSFVIGKLS